MREVSPRTVTANQVADWSPRPLRSSWVRPSDWLPLPTPSNSFKGLLAVYNDDSNYVALTAVGNYTVDWGDGTATENIASGVTAEHKFNYANVGSGTYCSRGYRQVIVTVTPQGGQTFSSLILNRRHSRTGITSNFGVAWLDISIDGPSLSTIEFSYTVANVTNIRTYALERVTILSHALTNASYLFNNCYALRSVPLFNTTTITNMSFMFQNCFALQAVPFFNTVNVTTMANMFYMCRSLGSVPLFNTIAVTTMANTFTYCGNLRAMPAFNTSNVTNMSTTFGLCYSLRSMPWFDTAKVTNMTGAFQQCYIILTFPLYNMALITNGNNLFWSCYKLRTIPAYNTVSNNTSTQNMFSSCWSLRSVPLLNTALVTSHSGMFTQCYQLKNVPAFDLTKSFDSSTMFQTCYVLTSVPAMNMPVNQNEDQMFSTCYNLRTVGTMSASAVVTSQISTFAACSSLSRIQMTGIKWSLDFPTCLESTELNELYTNLASVSAKTITVTGNPGVDADNPAIATAKGWTVTGS